MGVNESLLQHCVSAVERRVVDQVAHVRAVETMDVPMSDIDQTGAQGGVGLLPDDFSQRFGKSRLESGAWIQRQYIVDERRRDFVQAQPEDVHVRAHIDQGDFRLLAFGDTGAGVKRDRVPHEFRLTFRVAVRRQEQARGIGAVDLEALVGGECVCQSQIVKQGREVDDFTVVFQTALTSEEFGEPPRSMHVVQERARMNAFDEGVGLTGEVGIGSVDSSDGNDCAHTASANDKLIDHRVYEHATCHI
ncbi:hypothetical protein PCAR4_10192 [Paraburkholderia caribensis]|nr:hypothetical protein PCAR4_10192 [Paraburkholderia caribensis]